MISINATIQAERNISDSLIASLRPFISRVASEIRSGMQLNAALDIAAKLHPEEANNFVIESNPETFGLKSNLLFPEKNKVDALIFQNRVSEKRVSISNLSLDEACEVANTILHLSQSTTMKDALSASPYSKLIQTLFDAGIFRENHIQTNWNFQLNEAGIVRLQHASFLIKTLKARIIVDPHFVSAYSSHLNPTSMMMPQDFIGMIDAVLITHSHTDHYHVPSLMMLPRDTLIIVPQVKEATLLCPNFRAELRSMGFKNVVELGWYSEPKVIGDVEISALPFYGEQPLRNEHPRDKKLRNWGNSYFFKTPFYSAFCLIDSGVDADGSMLQVAEYTKHKFYEVDVVLSNLKEFYVGVGCGNPFYVTGGGHYWLSLTPDQISRLPQMSKELITLGTEGIAEICRILKPKTFLPYSHLWSEIGSTPPGEDRLMQELNAQPAISEARTEIKDWRIGESWYPKFQV